MKAVDVVDRAYVAQFERSLDYAKTFLLDVLEDPSIFDAIPDGAAIIPYPVAVRRGRRVRGPRKGKR